MQTGSDSPTPRSSTGTTPSRFLRLPEVLRSVGLQRSAIYAKMRLGRFPAPVKLTSTAVAWIEDEVEAWKAERIAESRGQATRDEPAGGAG